MTVLSLRAWFSVEKRCNREAIQIERRSSKIIFNFRKVFEKFTQANTHKMLYSIETGFKL